MQCKQLFHMQRLIITPLFSLTFTTSDPGRKTKQITMQSSIKNPQIPFTTIMHEGQNKFTSCENTQKLPCIISPPESMRGHYKESGERVTKRQILLSIAHGLTVNKRSSCT
ncbi:hypothetical protein CRENBAI_019308 [Crenichthys baileyi]|uniref:Uncharacterized protein n=1 Tax=Crenichthys baileyi TaxID=28760 RepID=A0AAV9QXM4_9TELE